MAGERSSSVPDEADKADEDQAGTNRLELCFALPAHIPLVRRWDTLSLRKLNPRRAAALDYYMSHPQIFFLSPPVTLKFYKPFSYLLQKSELFFLFLFCNICTPLESSLQLPVTLSSFQTGPSALLLKNHNVGQGCAWSLSLEGTFDLFFPTL